MEFYRIILLSILVVFCISDSDDDKEGSKSLFERLKLDEDIREYINNEIKTENIRKLLREITSKTHLAGSQGEKDLAEEIAKKWRDYGLDDVKVLPYSTAISSPDLINPSTIKLTNKRTGQVLHTSQIKEKNLDSNGNDEDIIPPFNAYSATGTPKGDMVFVNYGRIEDFLYLKKIGVQLTGKICIAKYGKIFRGDKAKLAHEFGAIGLILYTDPKDFAPKRNESVYPYSWWMPGTGVQRGTILKCDDPLTPGYPGIEGAYFSRDSENNVIDRDVLPKIPVHPIGYSDAQVFLSALNGRKAPKGWAGLLPIVYRIGGEFTESDLQIEMDITTSTSVKTTQNVVGVIRGTVEPDRYVMIGSHYDAWVYGAVDPGMATFMETSRMFAQLRSEGWKPRRTIVFAAWGAEEPGTLGSLEFVEQFSNILSARLVAYINCDVTMYGTYSLSAGALPMLFDVVKDSAQRVPNPNNTESYLGRNSVYDTWNYVSNNKIKIEILGSGSDHGPFIGRLGVTCAYVDYVHDPSTGVGYYPLYHSAYETFHLVNSIMDPTMKYHQATGRVFSQLLYSLTDAALLPFSVVTYSQQIQEFFRSLKLQHGALLAENNKSEALDLLEISVDQFSISCRRFENKLKLIDDENELSLRMYNDAMMQLERNFIDPLGLPGRPFTRNILYAPSQHNSYASSSFPGISDSLFEIEADTANKLKRWNLVSKQLSIVMTFIRSGADLLNSLGTF